MITARINTLDVDIFHADLVESLDGVVVIHTDGITLRLDGPVAARVAREVAAADERAAA